MTAGWRYFGLTLIALGLALRILIAPGLMPAVSPEGMTLTLCTAQGPVEYQLDIHGKQPASETHDPCPYGALAALPLLPVVLAVAPVLALVSLPASVPAATRPHIGAPAPPPASTGPPHLI